jgi:tripartite ATP-independent transporter DctP family solute receptor
MKRIWFAILVGLVLSPFVAFAQEQPKVKVPYVRPTKHVFRLAHAVTTKMPYHLGALRFAELVKTYSKGEIEINIFPNAQLGLEQVTAKMVQLGTLDMCLLAVNNSTMWYRPMDIYIMPFIFENREHVNRVLNGPVGKELEENYTKASGIRIVSWFEWGNRGIMNKVRPIYKPADLHGLKIRVPKNPVMVDTYNALGATATAIDWGELYSALQQGLADGLEGPPQGLLDMKFNDFLNHYSFVSVFYGLADLLMNEKLFQSLSPENQEAILRAGREAGVYQRWVSAMDHVNGLVNMEKAGVKVNKVEDVQAFVDAVKPVWEKYEEKIGKKWFDAVLAEKEGPSIVPNR